MRDRAQILDIIAKLKAKSESLKDLGNLAEAEAFAGKINELLTAYKLTMEEVEWNRLDQTDPIGINSVRPTDHGVRAKGRTYWIERLSLTIAAHHGCRILIYPGSSQVDFVGRESDREIAGWLHIVLCRSIEQAGRNSYDGYAKLMKGFCQPVDDRAGWLAGFYQGAVEAIEKRLTANRVRAEADSRALVRLGTEHVERWIAANLRTGTASGVRPSRSTREGRVAGERFGSSLDLGRRPVGPGRGAAAPRALGAGGA